MSGPRVARALWLAAALALAAGDAFAHLTDREVRRPVNYLVMVPPAAGQAYLDPVFGTRIVRISDARRQPDSADSGHLASIVNEYATMSPFNQDNSRLLLQHESYFALYDAEGRYQGDLPFDEITASSEPRWSRRDANLLYYVYRNSLKSYDATTGDRAVVRTFGEYSRISGRGESDICFDGDHFVLVGDDRDIFVYELSTDAKGPVLDATGHGFDNVHITPGDQVIVTWYATGGGARTGIELYDRDMSFQRRLAPAAGHMDVGRDPDGQAVLLWINAADPEAPPECQNGVVKIRLADGGRTCLLALGWSVAAHVSAPDGGEWFYLSTYAGHDPDPFGDGWPPYTAEVLQVRFDGSEVRRLAHHRSRPFNEYWYTPRAAASRDGRRLVYSSNYGLPSILGYPNDYTDAYLVEVADSSPSLPGSQSPITTRYEQDHVSVSYTGPWYPNALFFHSGGSAGLAGDAGARGTLGFFGSAVRWLGYRDEWAGIARVYLDGELHSIVDTYASPARAQAPLFSTSGLPAGPHVLEVEATGTRAPSSGGTWVWLDAFEVVVRAEQDDSAVSYRGAWQTDGHEGYSGETAVLATAAGAEASFRFAGTAVSWIGYRAERAGIARVSIDGTVRAEIDTYAGQAEAQAVVYTLSGLPAGEHTLAIEVTGRRHPLSLGDGIWVDAFETLPEAEP